MMAGFVVLQAKPHAFRNALLESKRPFALAPKLRTLYVTFAEYEYWKKRKIKTGIASLVTMMKLL